PVLGGPVRSPQYLGRSWTGCGPRLRVLGPKNRTEPDLKTLRRPFVERAKTPFVEGVRRLFIEGGGRLLREGGGRSQREGRDRLLRGEAVH
ncbi:hypothetical protein K443DRAFT_98009, partial [Laccaria amethystina LaAM-08-1]